MKKQAIKFATKEEYLTYPQTAKKYIPKWYKDAQKFVGGKPHINLNGDVGKPTIKSCIPFLDALTFGYIVELWQDIEVSYVDGVPLITWHGNPTVIDVRPPNGMQNFPTSDEYVRINFAWVNPFILKTPKNYSVLITHPLNNLSLPFTTLSGVVDSDEIMTGGSIPFVLKKGFTGIIPKGTPLFQIIPFKRTNWTSKIDDSIIKLNDIFGANVRRVIYGWYKKNYWKRKEYY